MAAVSRHVGGSVLIGLLAVATASWSPRPFGHYRVSVPAESSGPETRRYTHHERHAFEDGSDLELHWEVDAEPQSLLELDLNDGVNVVHCSPTKLLLEVPTPLVRDVPMWRHVTGSDFRHGCHHLGDRNLYHRILTVDKIEPLTHLDRKRAMIHVSTEELASPSQIFPHCSFRYAWIPAGAKEPHEAERDIRARRLSTDNYDTDYNNAKPTFASSLTPDSTAKHNSMFNLDIPRQVSNMGWNWNYDANTTQNPQFKYTMPGGVGWMRLYKPYLKAHFGLNVTFVSRINGIMRSPEVNVTGDLKGYADLNADIATAVNFKTDQSASVLDNVVGKIPLPGLENLTKEESYFRPVKFYFGGTPITVKPGFSCEMKAYHIGLLKGSLRIGLATKVLVHGLIKFDTEKGLQTNLSAKALNVSFTPPTWMLFTNHFEMGVMLQPTAWFKGGFGDMQDMEMGFALRPFFNVSIMQKNALAGTKSETRELAIYPWRAVGLPSGKNYVIRIGANGQQKMTSSQMSTGVAEYADNVEDFTFGMVEEGDLIGKAIDVAVLEDGKEPPVATGAAICTSVVNGVCSPGPVTAKMKVDGKDVEVHSTVVWQENALNVLESKIKSVSLRFPSLTLSDPSLTSQMQNPQTLANSILRLNRNGRTFSVPLAKKMNSSNFLKSRVIIEMGPCFLDSWKSTSVFQPMASAKDVPTDPTMAVLELVVDGKIAARGEMPPVQWDQASTNTNFDVMANSLKTSVTPIPAMIPLYGGPGGTKMVGTGELEIDVMPADKSAFWIFPYEAQDFEVKKSYAFTWTTHGAVEKVAYNFTLTAQLVGKDGSLTPTSWQKPVSVACTTGDIGIEIYRYHGGTDPCSFQVEVTVPQKLEGKRAVITALWLDANMMPHEMVSEPVAFVAKGSITSRRLDSANAGQWGVVSKGSVDHNGFGKKVKTKLANLRKHCNAQDLKYAVGAGMNFVEHLKNVMMPTSGMGMAGMNPGASNSASDWTSSPVSLFKLGNGPNHGKKLSKILPNSMCAGGACEGMMPGCQQTRVNPINIKQIVFKLSRNFKWKEHVGPKMRHIVGYALALLPSAIQISEKQIESQVKENVPPEVQNKVSNVLGISTTNEAAVESAAPTSQAPAATTQEPAPTHSPAPAPESMPMPPSPASSTPTPQWYTSSSSSSSDSGSSFENTAPFESSGPQPRRLEAAAHEDDEIDGPESLEGEDVEFDKFTVTIVKPMDYELTEELLSKIFYQNGFRGLEDGRETELGPVVIKGFELRDRPAVEREPMQAFELPDLLPKDLSSTSGGPSPFTFALLSGLAGAVASALAALMVTVSLALAARRKDYVAVVGMERQPLSEACAEA